MRYSLQQKKQLLAREKQIKGGSRKKKEDLINQENPTWKNLATDWDE